MLAQRLPHRSRLSSVALVAGLIVPSVAVARADGPEKASQPAGQGQPTAGARVAVVRGRVTDEAGAPLADVLVRVAVPATDMRHIDADAKRGLVKGDRGHKLLETRSDANGDYRLEIPGIAARTPVSIDAMKPGYRRLWGTLMRGGDMRRVEVTAGKEAKANLVLPPALYFAGIVVDQRGTPVPGVEVAAEIVIIHDGRKGSGGIERTASRADGTFELFNYPIKKGLLADPIARVLGAGFVYFSRPDYIEHRLEDVYAVAKDQRESLRVVLDPGHKIAGTVFDADGKPVPHAMVEAIRKDGTHRKAALTDTNGKFALRGLTEGLTMLTASDLNIKQKAQLPMALKADKLNLEVRMKPMMLPANPPTYTVLGMRLTDVTEDLRSAYDSHYEHGAMVLEPGEDFPRFRLGGIAEGNVFWMVGHKPVGSVRELVDGLLAETAGQNAEQYSVRVVYGFKTVEFVGNRTARLRFTNADRRELQTLSNRLSPDPR